MKVLGVAQPDEQNLAKTTSVMDNVVDLQPERAELITQHF